MPSQMIGFILAVAFDSLPPHDGLRKGTNRLL